ncbi:MAG TPA: hypothetical protein VHX40_00785 [Acidimicrobiales bacterium]|nr:hypothetical protein [Acidimicrobiales bacterium]
MTDGPAADRPDPLPGPRRARRVAWRLAGLTVGLVAVAGLAVGAVHGARSTTAQADDREVALGQLDVAYYDCLAAQVHSLVGPGQVVAVSTANPGNWATLAKAVAPWAVMTDDQRRAVAVLYLAPRHGAGSCLGSAVVARYPDGRVRVGTGGSLPGDEPPPMTPL